MMNIWQPIYDDWVGDFNPSILPVYAFYDFRVCKHINPIFHYISLLCKTCFNWLDALFKVAIGNFGRPEIAVEPKTVLSLVPTN